MSSSAKVIVQDLNCAASQEDFLKRMFGLCGTLNDIKIDKKGENDFEAELTFSNLDEAKNAVDENNGKVFQGKVVKVKLHDSNLDEAKKAVNDYNNTTLCDKSVNIKLHDSNSANQNIPKNVQTTTPQRIVISDDRKEEIGEKIYPIASEHFPNNAPKITGMILDAFSKLTNEQQLNEILDSTEFIVELVNAANVKHLTALEYENHK